MHIQSGVYDAREYIQLPFVWPYRQSKFHCSYIRLLVDMYTLIGLNKVCMYVCTCTATHI